MTTCPESHALSKDLKKRGFTFVGPTTVYAFMQAMGLVNDHLEGCHVRPGVEKARGLARDSAARPTFPAPSCHSSMTPRIASSGRPAEE